VVARLLPLYSLPALACRARAQRTRPWADRPPRGSPP